MKREFLLNFKVAGAQLPAEVIDAIMAENGRDIEAAKKPFADYDSIRDQLQTAKDSLKAFEGMDVQKLQGQIAQLQADLAAKDAAHQTELANMAFDRALDDAITGAKGRNSKAIKALLDLEALKGSKNQANDITAALEGLKKDSGYLFEDAGTPPPYSAGAGTGGVGGQNTGFNFGFTGVRAHDTGK